MKDGDENLGEKANKQKESKQKKHTVKNCRVHWELGQI